MQYCNPLAAKNNLVVVVEAAIVATVVASQGMVPLEPFYVTNKWKFD
jgi:hypothetical protein